MRVDTPRQAPLPFSDRFPTQHFVLTPSFHGATLLALLLSQHPSVVSLGDTNPPGPERWCSCGRRLSDCSFWKLVLGAIPSRRSTSGKMLPTVPELTASRVLNVRLTAALSLATIHARLDLWSLARKRFAEFAFSWADFWEAAILARGAQLTVDGEKSVTKFLAFRCLRDLDVRMIHLTRDPRAFAHSVNRHRLQKGLEPKTASAMAASWSDGHKAILRAARGLTDRSYLRVRYEDLASDPQAAMNRVFRFMRVTEGDVSGPPVNAHVFGNAMAPTFTGEVKLDTAWESHVSPRDQESLARSTEPLFSRLGYVR